MSDRSDNIRLVQKGAKIVLKEDTPSIEMDSRGILVNINSLKSEINKTKENLSKMETQIPALKKSLETNAKMLKKFEAFEDWATGIQKSKVKAIVEEIKAGAQKHTEENYKNDPTMSEEQNGLQKYRTYLGKMSMDPKIAAEIDPNVMRETFYTDPVIENPWDSSI